VRIIAGKKEAFQAVSLEQNFAGHTFSFDPEIIDEPMNGPGNLAVYHLVAFVSSRCIV